MTQGNNDRFEEGNANAHSQADSKDQRSLANRIAAEARKNDEPEDDPVTAAMKEDPTAPARLNGNEPSRGAKIDAEILAEEQAELERKGKA